MASLNDRYEVLSLLATGGMASVLYGRLKGPTGFQREVAIKRLHPHFACEPEFLAMFVDEAHLCARLSHANIVSALDVIDTPPDLCLVMEYVPGAGLDALLRAACLAGVQVPVPVAVALLSGVLHGLHAAHEARDESGQPLGIVHRDVSPSNVLVGQDGVARVLDFGVASCVGRVRSTPAGEFKGKFAYMAPELLRAGPVDRRLDVYAAAVVLWETLVGRRLFGSQPSASVIRDVLESEVVAPTRERSESSPELDAIVLRGLARDPAARFESAEAFAIALEQQGAVARQSDVSAWVRSLMGGPLESRALELRRLAQQRVAGARGPLDLLPSPDDTQKRTFLPSLMSEPPALLGVADTSSIPTGMPPARSRRWMRRAAAIMLLGAALQSDGKSSPTPVALAKASVPREIEVAACEVTRPTQLQGQRQLALLTSDLPRPNLPTHGKVRRRDAHPKDRQSLSAGRQSTSFVRAQEEHPSAAELPAADEDCRQAFQLETVNGVVIKTYKPRCLK